MPLAGLPGAHTGAATDETVKVLGLRQRPLRARGCHLETELLQQLAQLVRDLLAQGQRHAVRMVDHDPQARLSDRLTRQQFDMRKRAREALLDVGV